MMHPTVATVSIRLDRIALARLKSLGFLDAADRDPTSIRDAAAAALAVALAPQPEMRDARR